MEYKGYTIDSDFFRFMDGAKVTVWFDGDEFIFANEEEAKKFIDDLEA